MPCHAIVLIGSRRVWLLDSLETSRLTPSAVLALQLQQDAPAVAVAGIAVPVDPGPGHVNFVQVHLDGAGKGTGDARRLGRAPAVLGRNKARPPDLWNRHLQAHHCPSWGQTRPWTASPDHPGSASSSPHAPLGSRSAEFGREQILAALRAHARGAGGASHPPHGWSRSGAAEWRDFRHPGAPPASWPGHG